MIRYWGMRKVWKSLSSKVRVKYVRLDRKWADIDAEGPKQFSKYNIREV